MRALPVALVGDATGHAGMLRTFLRLEQVVPGQTVRIGELAPDEVIDLVGADVQKVRGVSEERFVKNDFAASEETRREDFIPGTGAKL